MVLNLPFTDWNFPIVGNTDSRLVQLNSNVLWQHFSSVKTAMKIFPFRTELRTMHSHKAVSKRKWQRRRCWRSSFFTHLQTLSLPFIFLHLSFGWLILLKAWNSFADQDSTLLTQSTFQRSYPCFCPLNTGTLSPIEKLLGSAPEHWTSSQWRSSERVEMYLRSGPSCITGCYCPSFNLGVIASILPESACNLWWTTGHCWWFHTWIVSWNVRFHSSSVLVDPSGRAV